MPESSDKLLLAVFRHLADGSRSPWELRRWSAVIAELATEANVIENDEVTSDKST